MQADEDKNRNSRDTDNSCEVSIWRTKDFYSVSTMFVLLKGHSSDSLGIYLIACVEFSDASGVLIGGVVGCIP